MTNTRPLQADPVGSKPKRSRATAGAAAAPPRTTRVRCPLKGLDDVKAELARLYRQARGGQVRVEDASKLANVLSILGRLIEGADNEARIAQLEKLLEERLTRQERGDRA